MPDQSGWQIEEAPRQKTPAAALQPAQAPSGWQIEESTAAPTAQPKAPFGHDYPSATFPVFNTTLPNGQQTHQRGDQAVWLDETKGYGGKAGWYWLQQGKHPVTGQPAYMTRPAGDVDTTGTESAMSKEDVAKSQRYSEALRDAEEQQKEFKRSRSYWDASTGTYKYTGPPLEAIDLAHDPSLYRPYLVRKGIGVGKALVGGIESMGSGALGAIKYASQVPGSTGWTIEHVAPGALGKGIGAIEGNRQDMFTPTPSEASTASELAGIVPIAGAAELSGPAAPAVLGTVFGGQAANEIEQMRKAVKPKLDENGEPVIDPATGQAQTVPAYDIGALKGLGYVGLNAAMGALPVLGSEEGPIAKTMFGRLLQQQEKYGILGNAAKESGVFATLNGLPTAYRQYLMHDDQANTMDALFGGAKTGALLGLVGGSARHYFGPKGEAASPYAKPPVSLEDAQRRVESTALASRGASPLDVAEMAGVTPRFAREYLDELHQDAEHPVHEVSPGRYGNTELRPSPEDQLDAIRQDLGQKLVQAGMTADDAAAYADQHIQTVKELSEKTGMSPEEISKTIPAYHEVGGEPAPEPVNMTFGGKNTRTVQVSEPDLVDRLSKAVDTYLKEKEAIEADKQQEGGGDPAARRARYLANGNKLRLEKTAIEQEIIKRQAARQAAQVPPPHIAEALAAEAAKSNPILSQQAAAEAFRQKQDLLELAKRATRAGDNSVADFRDTLVDQLGAEKVKDLRPEDIASAYREAARAVNAVMQPPRIRQGEDRLAFERRVAQSISNGMLTYYNGDLQIPDMPRNMLTEGSPVEPPTRDLSPREHGWNGKGMTASQVASPSNLMSGLYNLTMGKLFHNGFSPIHEGIASTFQYRSISRALTEWGLDLLHGVDGGSKIVHDMNDGLIGKYLNNVADMDALYKEGKEARAKGDEAYSAWLQTPKGQEFDRALKDNGDILAQIRDNNMKAARLSGGVRLAMYAESTPGSEMETNLRQMMTPEELKRGEALRQFYATAKDRLTQLGIPTLSQDAMYINHAGLKDAAPEAWNRLQDIAKRDQTTASGLMRDFQDVPEVLAYAHRAAGAVNMLPDAGLSLDAYIRPFARRIAYQGWLNKWMPAIQGEFRTEANPKGAPRLASYLADVAQKTVDPSSTEWDRAADFLANFEHVRTLSGSLSTPFKHLFKMNGVGAENGLANTFKAVMNSWKMAVPQTALESEAVQKFMKGVGMDPQNVSDVKQITEAFRRTQTINQQLDNIPGLESAARAFTKDTWGKFQRGLSSPLTLVEAWSRGVNTLATLYRAEGAGLSSDEAFRQMVHNNMALDFFGGWDTPGFQRSSLGRMATMYQQTPFKILENTLNWALHPEATDAFGTKNGVKFARYMMTLGLLATLGDMTDSPLVSHFAMHTPFIAPSYQTGMYGVQEPQPIQDLHGFFQSQNGGMASKNAWINYLQDYGTVQGNKYARLMSGNTPAMYGGSGTRYLLSIPKESQMKAAQAETRAKLDKRSASKAKKFLATYGFTTTPTTQEP